MDRYQAHPKTVPGGNQKVSENGHTKPVCIYHGIRVLSEDEYTVPIKTTHQNTGDTSRLYIATAYPKRIQGKSAFPRNPTKCKTKRSSGYLAAKHSSFLVKLGFALRDDQ